MASAPITAARIPPLACPPITVELSPLAEVAAPIAIVLTPSSVLAAAPIAILSSPRATEDGETFKFLGLTCSLLKNGMRINYGFLPQKMLFKRGVSGKEKVYKKIEKFVELIKGELFFKLSKNKEKYYFEVEGKDFIWNCVKDVNLNDNGLTISLKWEKIYNLNGKKLIIDLEEISFLVVKIFKEDS